ncbi:hypothetical protein BHU62_12010 [Serratia marcescens]|uniref:Uncharacterized protein n=1 Tax=Serratia marcescens TaxID=615 RepID=A0A1Q4P0G0_SERMA|nr:hypothetical protein [Serratia marcescens]OKB66587.1 hypothetical protein BHU62_12010 [Serratia marcescens]
MKGKTRQMTAKLAISHESVLARVRYLNSVIQSPAGYLENKDLLAALKSQNGLAKLSVRDFFITPMSLNTLKNRSNDILPGGFITIDNLRRQAEKKLRESTIVKSVTSLSATKQGLRDKIKVQEKIISQLWDEIALVTNIFRESIVLAKQFADKCPDPADQSLFKKRRRELLSMLSLSKLPPPMPSCEDLSDVE